MKIKSLSIAIILATSSVASAEVTLYDFTEATSSFNDAYINGQFNATDGNGHDQTAYNANLSLDYDRVFSSPNRNLGVRFNADGSISRSAISGSSSTSNYLATGGVTADNYFRPGSKGLFWYGSADAGLQKGASDPFAKLGLGLGYGRVVNVTPMAKAIRLIEALGEENLLSAKPAKSTYQRIAQIIAREDEYKNKHRLGNYEQHWIGDIEKALASSGTIAGTLNAAGVIETRDVLVNERISTRKHGWLVRAGLGVILSNYDGSDGGDPTLDIGAEYHRPLNNKTQFSNVASYSSIFGDSTGYRLNNIMTLTYELSDKIDWENAWLLNHNNSTVSGGSDVTSNNLTSTLRYYLDNQLDLTVTAKAANIDDDISGNGNDDTDFSLNAGVSYRLR